MTTSAVQAVGERIASDLEFAQLVYEDPKAALPGDFDLTEEECETLYELLSAAIDEAFGDVRGYGGGQWGGFEIQFDGGGGLGNQDIGSATGGAGAGKVTFNPFVITKKIDKASPVFFNG